MPYKKNDPDNNIPGRANKKKSEPLDQDVADFLKAFTSSSSKAWGEDAGDSDGGGGSDWMDDLFGWESWSLDNYDEVEITPEAEASVARLVDIAAKIETKLIKPDTKSGDGDGGGSEDEDAGQEEQAFKIDYKNSLNPAQYAAATTINGPLLVIAGAGSGKTRTVTYRVSYMLEKGIPPEQILLLTFTRKAAGEMIKRTQHLLQDDSASRVMSGTYHAFANYCMRYYATLMQVAPNFTIVDQVDGQDIIDLIRGELKFTKRSRAFPKKGRVQKIFSKMRNCGMSVVEVVEKDFSGLKEFIPDLEKLFKVFQLYKQRNNIYDYDDLMEVLRNSLRDNIPFRRKVQERFKYIMVDEFQDSNLVQKDIVDLIAEQHQNVMVVGDDAQSIYAFRGANFENILTFPETYPKCKVVKVEQNYRSNQDLLNFTNSIIDKAVLGYKKRLYSDNENQFLPLGARFYDIQEEATFIVDKVLELREKNVSLDDMAVLYRSSFHGNAIQAELIKRSIPYIVVGGIKFVERRHVKDMVAYLRIILNPYDAVAWTRILKLIAGVGKVTASKIIAAIQENNGQIEVAKLSKRKYSDDLLDLQEVLQSAGATGLSLPERIDILAEYYEPLLKLYEDNVRTRMKDVEVLRQLATKYNELDKFLSDFALDPPSNKYQDQNTPLIDESEEAPLTLSTIHSSKGLEWYAVFVPHLLDGVFPSSRALKSIYELEEERRLFYVACSRAKEQLYLTMPSKLSNWEETFTRPSRFLIEVDSATYRVHKPEVDGGADDIFGW